MLATLTVLMGIPGAGKSTWAAGQSETVLSADAVRDGANPAHVFSSMTVSVSAVLVAGGDVVVDACSLRPQQRGAWLRLARRHHASTRLVVVSCPVDVAVDRQSGRPPDARVPVERLERYGVEMSKALLSIGREGWGVIDHVSGAELVTSRRW